MKLSSAAPLARCIAGLVDHILHVARRQELALLDVDGLATDRAGANEIGLPAQEGGGLQNIHHASRRRDLILIVHVGQHRHSELLLHRGQDAQPLSMPRPRKHLPELRFALSKLGFINERNAKRASDFFQAAGGIDGHLLGFDHTWAGNQKQRSIQPHFKAGQFHAAALCAIGVFVDSVPASERAIAASTNALNNGCPWRGVDVNSG